MDPLSMAKTGAGIVARPVFNILKESWEYVNKYDSNIDEVQRQRDFLKNLRKDIQLGVDSGEMNNEVVASTVERWMEDVDQFMESGGEEWKELLLDKEERRKAERSCYGSCWNPMYRYNQSKRAVELTDNIKRKIQEFNDRGTNLLTHVVKPPALKSISCSFFKGLKSREKNLTDIMEKLRINEVNKIGIHGMGGSGKTTLVQELARRCERENMFDVVVIAEISEVPDIKRIQDEIANRIGFYALERYHSIEERAMNLSKRLMRIREGRRIYSNNDQHREIERNKLGIIKSKGNYLDKALSIHYLDKLGSTKENKIKDYIQKDQLEIIGEEGQLKMSKYEEDDKRDGLEKGKSPIKEFNQEGPTKKGKLLVILDNMWQNLELRIVGIPHDLEKDLGCKIIVTSRNEDVCKAMGVQNICIFKVGDLDGDEAMQLFKVEVGEIADNESYKKIIPNILKKCSHLPLSISLMAKTLKNQPLSVWEHVLKRLDNPIEEEILRVFGQTYSVIEMSYKLLGSKKKKMFFLLCCIFPPGSTINVINLLRYGIGLDLFQHVDNIVEAIDQACQWANDLKSLSLLSEVDVNKGEITIHDDVRKAGKSFGERDYAFHVGPIPCWMKRYSYEKYKLISMTSNKSYEHLDGKSLPELQLLRSLRVESSKLSPSYFTGMISLKVLDMSDSNIESFPSSFGDLANLEILVLERCSLKDLFPIWKLVNLLVLSFKESNITYLSEDMRALIELKLLDLTDCIQLKEIASGIFIHLKKLEGLYMQQSFSDWTTTCESGASLAELACLPLKVLEIDIQSISQLSDGNFPILGVINYKIGLAGSTLPPFEHDQIISSHDLQFAGVNACDLIKEGWKNLLNKVEILYLNKIKDLEDISPYLGEYWSDLKKITVSECSELQYFVNPKDNFQLDVFSKLENLQLEGLRSLKAIYHGKSPVDFFSSLQELIFSGLSELCTCDIDIGNVTRMRVLEVKNCQKLVSIFSSQERGETYRFPLLKKLILVNLQEFEGLFAQTTTEDTEKFLFPMQVIFPCLDKIKLDDLGKIDRLWDIATTWKEFVTAFPELRSISLRAFEKMQYLWRNTGELQDATFNSGKLKKLKIISCNSLEIVFPLSVATGLHELELLHIHSCDNIKKVISSEGGSTGEQSKQTMSFSKLQTLNLWFLPELTYFYQGVMKIGFPSLKILNLQVVPKMKTLLTKVEPIGKSKENKKTEEYEKKDDGILFNGEVEFPVLESLYAKDLDSIERLWDFKIKEFGRIFPGLQLLWIHSMGNLKHVWHDELIGETMPVSINLKSIEIYYCDSLESLFAPLAASSYTNNIEVEFPELKSIDLKNLCKFRYLLEGNVKFPVVEEIILKDMTEMVAFSKIEKSNASRGEEINIEDNDDPTIPLFNREVTISVFPQLKRLYLTGVIEIKFMKSLLEATLLQKLKLLNIERLNNLRYLVSSDDDTVSSGRALVKSLSELKNLEELVIWKCESLEGLFQVDEDPQDNNMTLLLSSLRKLTLVGLWNLISMQWHMLPNIQSLFVQSCDVGAIGRKQKFLIPATSVATGLSLQSLESMTIADCNSIETVIGGEVELKDDDSGIVFPRLKEVKIQRNRKLRMFCSIEGNNNTLRLPSLETVEFEDCGILTTFSSGLVEAPKLSSLKVNNKLLINTRCGDPNIALQHEFDSEYKITKHWPRWLNVKLHEGHSIILSNSRTGELCGGCGKEIMKYSYSCVPCKFDLDPVCALDTFISMDEYIKDWPKTLIHRSDEHELKLVAGRDYSCNICQQTGKVYSYTCEICELDMHPKCALVESQLNVIPNEMKVGKDFPKILRHELHEHKLRLVAGRTYRCDGCGQKTKDLFSYYCDKCDFDLHPKCALEGSHVELKLENEINPLITQYWPKTLMHRSDEHELKLVAGVDYSCSKCHEIGKQFSYTCAVCEFSLHPECALDENQLNVVPGEMEVGKYFSNILRHESHEHELKLVAGRLYICDECGQSTGELFSYYCKTCDFDLHLECALEGSSVEPKFEEITTGD